MMHGHEKSRSAIVAVKPTNKALHSAAEAVERRAAVRKGDQGCRADLPGDCDAR
jgi:hypothetical protein